MYRSPGVCWRVKVKVSLGLYLAHELGNDAVEAAALVSEALVSSAQDEEVLSCLRNHVGTQLHHDAADRLAALIT